MCFICCGDMVDGRIDCQVTGCPLYTWQPYKKHEVDLRWREEGSHLRKNREALMARFKRSDGIDKNGDKKDG